jgi:alkanesulfonate monooxygenase SsuD/methylene tetrahydromethanopterin reductase-like flavin-dependent oxidoreductase (luciferase family)
MGALTFAFVDAAEAKHWVDDYYRILKEECVPIGHAINPNIAIVTGFSVHPDAEEAKRRGMDGFRFFGYALAHYYAGGSSHDPGNTDIMRAFESATQVAPSSAAGGCIGSPQTIRERLLAYEAAGIDQIIFVAQAGATKHEDIMSSLRLFARELLPEFKERDLDHQRRRQEWLAAPAEAAL